MLTTFYRRDTTFYLQTTLSRQPISFNHFFWSLPILLYKPHRVTRGNLQNPNANSRAVNAHQSASLNRSRPPFICKPFITHRNLHPSRHKFALLSNSHHLRHEFAPFFQIRTIFVMSLRIRANSPEACANAQVSQTCQEDLRLAQIPPFFPHLSTPFPPFTHKNFRNCYKL